MCGNQALISGCPWSLPPDIHALVESSPTLNEDQSIRPTECSGIRLPRLNHNSQCNIHHLLLHHSFWREPAAISSTHSNSPIEKHMWEVPEASQWETCEEAILEVDPPASGKPSDDGYPSWHLTPSSWKSLSKNHTAKPLLNF